jgi:hypothetical protein
MYISIFSLVTSIISVIVFSLKSKIFEENIKLRNEIFKLKDEISSLKNDVLRKESRIKNILGINKGQIALLTQELFFKKGLVGEKKFVAYYEVEILEVTDYKVKVIANNVITDNNSINNNQSEISSLITYIENKWISRSDIEPLLDKQTIREDKLSELLLD